MKRKLYILMLAFMALLMSGCAMRTVEEMYALPRRSEEYSQFQSAIDAAMEDLTYAAPISGDNQQTVQMADLNGDGKDEYLVFALGDSEKPLQVLIFTQDDSGNCSLSEVIESNGTAFEQVEYINFDERPGCELVIGRQVSNQILRSVSVYTFSGGSPEQLFAIGYSKFLTCDLDGNGRNEVMVLRPGETETDRGMAVLYSTQGGRLRRSVETELSQEPSRIRRIQSGKLRGGKSAIFVASAVDEQHLVTDIFSMKNGSFTNIAFYSELDTSIQTLLNFYVYAEDIDEDGVMELPSMLSMQPVSREDIEQKVLLRWFSMDEDGVEENKLYTFHDFLGGWYVKLDSQWAQRVTMIRKDGSYMFLMWDEDFETAVTVFSIDVFTGSTRDEDAQKEGRFPLYRSEGIAYAGRLEKYAPEFGITKEYLMESFCMIRQDRWTEEN